MIGKTNSNYKNSKTIMEWKCLVCDNIWKAPWHRLNENHGCPYCSKFVTENICRILMEKKFNDKFIKTRPKWLNVHLDGYCEKLGIAFEYNGKQHYTFESFFHSNYEEFEKLQFRDATRVEKCNENNVILIVIPYWIENEAKEQYIIEQYKEKTGNDVPYRGIDWKLFFSYKEKCLQELKELTNEVGYDCLSLQYVDNNSKLKFRCSNGHTYWTTPHIFKSGYRCPKCPRRKRGKYNIKKIEGKSQVK